MGSTRIACRFLHCGAAYRLLTSSNGPGRAPPGGRGNCTPSPVSASPLDNRHLRILSLSLAAPQERDPDANLHELAAVDARLARLCAAWTSLPEHIILAILALVDSTGVEAERLETPCRDSPGFDRRRSPPEQPGIDGHSEEAALSTV
jgi:hypothetical protein